MTKPLSPEAQAVLDAMVDVVCTPPISLDEPPPSPLAIKLMAAAALRAAADQAVPPDLEEEWEDRNKAPTLTKMVKIRRHLYAIAANLENFKNV